MDDTLSKWLNGELSDKELSELIGEKEALKYIQIVGEVDRWVPDQSTHLFNPKEITSKPKGKVRTMRSWYSYAAAAVILLTVVSYLWILGTDSMVSYSSQMGEVRVISLPDGESTVTLASNSEISWDEKEWEGAALAMKENRLKSKNAKRKVNLKGKAFFKIKKGSPFSVESSSGTVKVLGTTFEVDDFEAGFNVICFEGKVEAKPKTSSKSIIVTRGQGYLFFNGKWEDKVSVSGSVPAWLQNQTKFENAPLDQVIKTLEKLYGITIDKGSVNTSRRFTGSIPNDKLNVALRIAFAPFEINYTRKGKKITLSE